MTDLTMSQFASKDDLLAAQAARIAELESQLEAIGAGGVEPLRKPVTAPQAVQAAVPVAWRLTNTAFRKPRFEYHDTKESAEQRQADFNRSVDDGGLHNLTPLYAAPAHPAEGVPAQSYVADFFREKGFYPSLAQAFAAGVAHAAAMPAQTVDEIMELADEYAGAQACAVTATSTADADTTKERNALLSAIRAALAATQPAAQGMDAQDDTALLNFLQTESWDLRCFDAPTGAGDGEIHWKVIEHHMAAPHEREVGRAYSDDPREAIRNAIGNATNIAAQAKQGGA